MFPDDALLLGDVLRDKFGVSTFYRRDAEAFGCPVQYQNRVAGVEFPREVFLLRVGENRR